jgi:O-antigen/teichoic acid export membrane protein
MVIANFIGSVFGYIYLLIMARILSPDTFGVFGALFSVFYITCLAGQALREAIAVRIAETRVLHGDGVAIAGFIVAAKKLGLLALVPTTIFVLAAAPISSFFHVTSVVPVVVLGFSLFTALGLDIVLGLQQGLQQFRRLGSTGFFISQGLKLVFGASFVWIGWGLDGAISSLLASTTVAMIAGIVFNRVEFRQAATSSFHFHIRINSVLGPALVLGIFMALPTSGDVMIVNYFFGGYEAGLYSAIATLGKVVIFLPIAVSFVLLPKVSERHNSNEDTRGLLKRALVAVMLLSGVVVLICVFFPQFVIQIFFGEAYLSATGLVWLYVTAMLLCSLNIVTIHYSLAIRKNWLLIAADVATGIEAAIIYLRHQSLAEVMWILLLGNLVVFAISFPVLALRPARRSN